MPIRLDSTNFFVWKYLMTTIFRAHNLIGYVDGSIKSPDKFSPSYETWMAHDAGVMVLIHASLSSSTLPLIVDCDTARELWLKLEENCSSLSNFHVAKFRSDLETITKGGDSVDAYVQRIEEIRVKLAGFHVVVDDAEMMVHAQRGLPTEYNEFRASMAARNGEALSLDGFYVLLLEEEAALRARS